VVHGTLTELINSTLIEGALKKMQISEFTIHVTTEIQPKNNLAANGSFSAGLNISAAAEFGGGGARPHPRINPLNPPLVMGLTRD
jgi:hypothetical protein